MARSRVKNVPRRQMIKGSLDMTGNENRRSIERPKLILVREMNLLPLVLLATCLSIYRAGGEQGCSAFADENIAQHMVNSSTYPAFAVDNK